MRFKENGSKKRAYTLNQKREVEIFRTYNKEGQLENLTLRRHTEIKTSREQQQVTYVPVIGMESVVQVYSLLNGSLTLTLSFLTLVPSSFAVSSFASFVK